MLPTNTGGHSAFQLSFVISHKPPPYFSPFYSNIIKPSTLIMQQIATLNIF